MKIFFFIALLINIILFLWEFNSGGLNSPQEIAGVDSHKTKQILLVSELSSQDEGNSLKIAENNPVLYDPVVSLALNSATNSKTEEEAEESSKQLIKSSSTSIEEFPENLMNSEEQPLNEQIEQNTLQHDTEILETADQADSIAVSPAMEEKPLTGESQKDVVNSLLNNDESKLEAGDQVDSLAVTPVLEEKPLTGDSQEEVAVNSLLNRDESNIEAGDQIESLAVIPVLEEKPLTGESQEKIIVNSLLNSEESNIDTGGQVDSLPVSPVLEEKPLTGESQEDVVVSSLSSSDEPNVEQANPDNNYCYHVGPFLNHNALIVWRKLNKIDEGSVSRINKESDVVSSYLVYFPAAETYAQSRKNVQLLKQKGITDYWLFRRGELKGAISLGLFVKKSRALSLQKKLVKAGFTTEIKERYKTDKLLYAEISTKDKAFKDTVNISDKQGISQCENNTEEGIARE